MPPPRKVDQLPQELRLWLQEELKASGFSGYEELAERLNARLIDTGLSMTIGKSALHDYGREFKDFTKHASIAQEQIRAFMEEADLKDETDVTKALFQQLTHIQWRLQMEMSNPEALPNPKGMKDLTTALNNLIRSTALRDAILKSEHDAQKARIDDAVKSGDLDAEAAKRAREIMGFG